MCDADLSKKKDEQPETTNFIIMKTTRQRLLNIAITMSVIINLAMLGAVGYIASLNHHDSRLCFAMNQPVVVYVPKNEKISDATTTIKPSAKP